MYLETERLLLIPTPLHVLRARLERAGFTADLETPDGRLTVEFPAQWPGDALAMFEHKTARFDPARPTWGGTLVHREERCAIGQMSFKSGPDASGTVELGYGLNPSHHGHGYATEMVRAMIGWARRQPSVRRITAETRTDNAASMRVLEKAGLVRVGRRWCDQDGELVTWELPG